MKNSIFHPNHLSDLSGQDHKTTDGGRTFFALPDGGQWNGITFYSALALNRDTVFFVGAGGGSGAIARTTNGGQTWVNLPHPVPQGGWNTLVFDQGVLVVAGGGYDGDPIYSGVLIKSTNYGMTWDSTWFRQYQSFDFLTVVSPGRLVVGSGRGKILTSINGGQAWLEFLIDSNHFIRDVVFREEIGYVLTTTDVAPATSKLFRTTDSGNTWSQVYVWQEVFGSKNGLALPTGNTVIVFGNETDGINPSWNGFWISYNGGTEFYRGVEQSTYVSPTVTWMPDWNHGIQGAGDGVWYVNPLPTPVVSQLSAYTVRLGEQYSRQLQATGTGLHYHLEGSPSWLSVDSTGVVRGTPTNTGTFTVQYWVGDTLWQRTDGGFTLTVLPNPPPVVPTLSLPTNGAINQSTTPSLSWHPVSASNRFHLEVASDSNLSAGIVFNDSTLTDTACTVGPLTNGVRFYWHVRAGNSVGWSPWSERWTFTTTLTSVNSVGALPNAFGLEKNYPNPFNSSTTIRFQQPTSQHVTLKVHDVLGRDVRTLLSEKLQAGSYETTFDAAGLASGVYFYRLQAGDFADIKRLVILR